MNTWFYGGCGFFERSPNSVLDTTPKNVLALMFFKTYVFLLIEIITQKLA